MSKSKKDQTDTHSPKDPSPDTPTPRLSPYVFAASPEDLYTCDDYKSFLPALQPAEYAELRRQLERDGQQEPITVTPASSPEGGRLVVDGHNRLEILKSLGVDEIRYRELLDLPDDRSARTNAVKRWMLEHQGARRNMSKDATLLVAAMAGLELPNMGSPQERRLAGMLAASDHPNAGKARAAVLSGGYKLKAAAGACDLLPKRPRSPRNMPQTCSIDAPVEEVRIAQPKEVLQAHRDAAAKRAAEAKLKSTVGELADTRRALEILDALTSTPLPPIPRRELHSGLREATAVALMSDMHVEEIVRPGDTPTGNEYNPKIADRALERFFLGLQWLVSFHRSAFEIRSLVLWLGGDLMTGHIHEENVETGATTPIETLLILKPRLLEGIRGLLADPELEDIHVVCSYGNHGRNTRRPYRSRGAEHSYEWLLYQDLAAAFEGEERVRFLADRSGHQYATALGYDLHFHHGDEVNYGGGVGGITIPLNKAVAQWDRSRKCHYHHFGHFHQYIDVGNVLVNGSGIGFNGFAMSIKAAPEPPQQAFYLLDSRRGKTCKSGIWVRD